MNKIMNHRHPSWIQFCDLLVEELGLVEENRCNYNYHFALKVLNNFPDIDMLGTLRYFKSYSGRCDCTIIFNIQLYDLDSCEDDL